MNQNSKYSCLTWASDGKFSPTPRITTLGPQQRYTKMHIRALTCSLLVSCVASSLASASNIAIVPGQTNTEQLVYPTTYQVTGTPATFTSTAQWTYWQSDCTPPSNPINPGNGNPSINYGIPGTFQIQCVLTYMPGSATPAGTPTPAAETVSYSVTIQPPSIVGVRGTGAATDYATSIPDSTAQDPTAKSLGGQPGCWIYFILKSNSKTIGPQINGFTVQEKLTNFMVYGLSRADSDWRPNNPTSADLKDRGPSTSFYIGQFASGDYAICDFKSLTSFYGEFRNGVVCTYTQENRIFWNDLNGNQVIVALPPFDPQTNNWTYTGVNGPRAIAP